MCVCLYICEHIYMCELVMLFMAISMVSIALAQLTR